MNCKTRMIEEQKGLLIVSKRRLSSTRRHEEKNKELDTLKASNNRWNWRQSSSKQFVPFQFILYLSHVFICLLPSCSSWSKITGPIEYHEPGEEYYSSYYKFSSCTFQEQHMHGSKSRLEGGNDDGDWLHIMLRASNDTRTYSMYVRTLL